MIVQKINYEQLFPNPYVQFGNIRFGMDITLQEGDSIADAYTKAHKEANDNFNRLFPPPLESTTTVFGTPNDYDTEMQGAGANGYGAQVPQKQSAEQRMINSINSCTEIKVLETYKLLVKNNPVFQQAYDTKMTQLLENKNGGTI